MHQGFDLNRIRGVKTYLSTFFLTLKPYQVKCLIVLFSSVTKKKKKHVVPVAATLCVLCAAV